MSVTNWTSIFQTILQALSLFPRDNEGRTKDQEEALIALSEAYHATHKYYSEVETGKRNRNREWDIAEKWYRVSVLLKKYNPDLSRRLHRKSRFWQDGGTWSNEQIAEAGIGLEGVWSEVNVLLSKPS